MRTSATATLLFAASTLLPSCKTTSLQWVDKSVQAPPAYFSARNSFPDESGLYRYKLTELPGRILYRKPGETKYHFRKVVLKDGYQPRLEVVPDADGRIFDAVIDSKIAASATYLALSASVDAKSMASVHVQDRVLSFIANADVPWTALSSEAGPLEDNSERYWIQGVLMASLDYTKATEVDLKAGGKLSEAFGANGKVYNKADAATHDYRLSLELIDLRQLALANKNMSPSLLPDFLTSARPARLVISVRE